MQSPGLRPRNDPQPPNDSIHTTRGLPPYLRCMFPHHIVPTDLSGHISVARNGLRRRGLLTSQLQAASNHNIQDHRCTEEGVFQSLVRQSMFWSLKSQMRYLDHEILYFLARAPGTHEPGVSGLAKTYVFLVNNAVRIGYHTPPRKIRTMWFRQMEWGLGFLTELLSKVSNSEYCFLCAI